MLTAAADTGGPQVQTEDNSQLWKTLQTGWNINDGETRRLCEHAAEAATGGNTDEELHHQRRSSAARMSLLTVRLFRGLFQSWASGSFLPLPMLYQSLSKVFPLSKPEPEHNWSNNPHRLNCFQRCQEWGAPEELLTALIRLSGCLSLLSHFYQCQTKTRQKRKIRKLKHELFVVVFWRRSHRKSYD